MLVEKAETQSTNDDARALAMSGAPHGLAVLARSQRAGRGRAGRAFSSPAGGLYLSIILRPASPPERWGVLPLASGVAIVEALARHGFAAAVKWPNDVLISGRKVAGILVDAHLDAAPFAIVGVGLNVQAAPPDAPGATALAAHGRPPELRALAQDVVTALLEEARRMDEEPSAVVERVRARCVTLGRDVEWEDGAGAAVDIDPDGALVVERHGERTRVVAGDVRVRQRV